MIKIKGNYTDAQITFAYILFEILEQEFKSVTITNPFVLKSFFIQYKEQKARDTERMEAMIESYIREELKQKLPTGVWHDNMKMILKHKGEGNPQEIWFIGNSYILKFVTEYLGASKANILCKYKRIKRENSKTL